MTERILGPTGSPKRRRFLFVPIVMVVLLAAFWVAGAQAVHDEDFQLEGDVLSSTTTNIDSKTQAVDWNSLFNDDGTTKSSLPTGFDNADLTKDFNTGGTAENPTFVTSDSTTFSTGSKDTLPISGWQCNLDNNVNSKIDVMNAYAATYTASNDDEYLYFGLERNVNTGDANVGFWFMQDAVGCTSAGPSVTFSGEHKDGDLLIVSEFSGGGTVSTINVYRWDRFTGDCGAATPVSCVRNPEGVPGFLNTTPVGNGVDCRAPETGVDDTACGASNRAAQSPLTIPWLTSNKTSVGHSLGTAQFFEAGLNLTQANLGGKCFNTFLADTRSSTSLTATLFDFTGGTLGSCETTLTTTAGLNGATTTINSSNTAANGTASSGVDNATLAITGVNEWAGTLKFYLCGPMATVNDVCNANGVLVSTLNVDETTTQPIPSGNGTTTGFKTLTSAGRYCWFAEFTPDAETAGNGVDGDSDGGTAGAANTECFTVGPATPTLDTLAGTSPVDLGQAVTDTATLSGAAKEPGNNGASNGGDADWPSINATNGVFVGTIGFTLKGPDTTGPPFVCSTTNATAFAGETQTFPISVTVTGNGTTSQVSFKPGAPGPYHWVAVYSHTAATVNNSGLPVTHNANCADGDEAVTVRQIPTEIRTKQNWIPNDTAEIKATIGNLAAGGTVVFSLYDTATCTGSVLYTETKTLAGGSPTEEVFTTNTGTGAGSLRITSAYTDGAGSTKGKYSWKVVYTPAAADTAHTGKQSACDAENFTITYKNDAGPGT
jgi:hypothetical protein